MNRPVFGSIAVLLGSASLLLALFHFWGGPFSPQPTIETTIADKVSSIRQATIDAIKGKEAERETLLPEWDADKITDVAIAMLGGLAIVLAVISLIRKESKLVGIGAASLGTCGIAFQFIAMYAMVFLLVLLIAVALQTVGIEIS